MASSPRPSAADAGATGPAIELRGVTKTYRTGTLALGPIDLNIGRGEFVSLLGPSGCGKSTALRMIAGLAEPSSGRIEVGTASPRSRGEHPIGFVFQEPTLMPWASIRHNVALPLKLAHVASAEIARRVDEVLARVDLSEFADAFPRELSGGMKMRASLARALVTRPDILLMDEPFAALDEITRFRLNDDLLALWRELQMTVVFVTHSVFESVYLSQRVVVMTPRPGRIAASFDIDAPTSRGEEFRLSADYAAQCREVSRALASTGESPTTTREARA
ncbi:ABC transporter ATP-binding protein [Rhodopseudomonas palustris]|uniref:ABC transporter ATP-binding protein n=1 Tax=Rhodopseudomonas palustris TaxID=1076 RepID=UPI0021F394FD|nr:ABC transporter ATP-binding protein [Rhodopseudomonas palustris]UYO44906.1 ABC transporter ATP-binding protein [Rhodopseudomonas palustris]